MTPMMKQWLLLVLAVAAAADQPPATRALTLRECLERALAQNLDVQIERLNPRIESWNIVGQQGVFDPAFTGSARYRDATESLNPERQTALGVSSLEAQQLRFDTGLNGLLPTGTRYSLAAFDTRDSGTLSSNFTFTGTAAITLTQPLLQDFGLGANTAQIRIARQNRQIAEETLAQQVINTISDVENAYYELVFAIEDHKAKIEDWNRAKALLAENRKRVELGVLSPLDITQAEAGVAEREEAVILTERAIKDQENALKRLIAQDVQEFRGTTLVPVDAPPVQMIELDAARSIATALETRPDFRQSQHEVERQGILVKFNRNQLWPQIDLEGSYGYNGIGGSFGQLTDSVGSGGAPAWSVGVVVTVPLGNRQARDNFHSARLTQDQLLLSLKRLEQDIIVEVDNAVGRVETNLKRVEATAAARRLAEESLRAEEEKLRAGTSTSFLVLQAQAQLAAARSAEIRARADYNQSLVELARSEGTTLLKHQIAVEGD